VTDVAGDRGPERVVIHEKDVVVFGKGFKGGTSYAYITVGVAEGKDIVDATARDLTGDGKAEIIVRGLLHAKASKALGGDVVDRYALFVYSVQGDAVMRVFAAETGRAVAVPPFDHHRAAEAPVPGLGRIAGAPVAIDARDAR